jgi:hypothetical protein
VAEEGGEWEVYSAAAEVEEDAMVAASFRRRSFSRSFLRAREGDGSQLKAGEASVDGGNVENHLSGADDSEYSWKDIGGPDLRGHWVSSAVEIWKRQARLTVEYRTSKPV